MFTFKNCKQEIIVTIESRIGLRGQVFDILM